MQLSKEETIYKNLITLTQTNQSNLKFVLLLGVEAASRNNERESLDFILPNPNEELGAKCLQFR